MKSRIGVRGFCELTLRDKNGRIKDRRAFFNNFTTVGFDLLCDILGAAAQPDQISHIGIGWGAGANTAFALGQTDLQGASKDRRAGSFYHDPGDNFLRFLSVWGPDQPLASTVPIEESGIFNAASGGTMLNRRTFSVLNKQKEDTLEVKWTITFVQL